MNRLQEIIDLLQTWPLNLISAVGLLIVFAWIFRQRVRAAAEAAQIDQEAGEDLPKLAGETQVVDLRSSPAREKALRRSFRRGLHDLREFGGPYSLPWFLCLGQVDAGKTSLLGKTQLPLPAGEPDLRNQSLLNWWLFDNGLLLDLQGILVLDSDNATSDMPAWNEFLRLCRRSRRRRPLDGVLLTIPVDELLAYDLQDDKAAGELATRAYQIQRKLAQLQNELGMVLPVDVLVSKTDLIEGFAEFDATFDEPPGTPAQRREIFGWSNPNGPATPYSSGWLKCAFESIEAALERRLLNVLITRAANSQTERKSPETAAALDGMDPATPAPGDVAELLAFPARFSALNEPLSFYLNQIFAPAASVDEPYPFRGLYFCGGVGFSQDAAPKNSLSTVEDPCDSCDPCRPQRIDFLRDVFSYKLFYEWNLAIPTKAAMRKGRKWKRRLQIFSALLLTLGPLLLALGHRQVAQEAAVLDDRILRPSLSTLQKKATTGLSAPDLVDSATKILTAKNDVSSYRLQNLFLPASWLASYARDVAQAMQNVEEQIIFPAARTILQARVAQAVDAAAPAPREHGITRVETTATFPFLSRETHRLHQISTATDDYNCFAEPRCSQQGSTLRDRYVDMVGNTFIAPQGIAAAESPDSIQLDFPSFAASRFQASVLKDVFLSEPITDSQREIRDIRSGFLDASDQMYAELYGRGNILIADLESLEAQIDYVDAMDPDVDATSVYQNLLDAVDRTRRDLERPGVAWAGKKDFNLGPIFNTWLASVADETRFLGPRIAQRISHAGAEGYNDFRADLAAFSSEGVGYLLARDKNGDPRLELSENVLTLEKELQDLIDQSFMDEPSNRPRLTLTPPPGTYLSWDGDPLRQALKLQTEYDQFAEEAEVDPENPLVRSVQGSAQVVLEANMLQEVAQAQECTTDPLIFNLQQCDAWIGEQIDNFQFSTENGVADSLDQLLKIFSSSEPAFTAETCSKLCAETPWSAWCELDATLQQQQRSLLDLLAELLDESMLYEPKNDDFSWWDGSSNIAFEAYGVNSANGLESFIAREQQIVTDMTCEYVAPLLTGLPDLVDCWNFSEEGPGRLWKVILNDLESCEKFKPDAAMPLKPDNPIVELSNFIGQTMPTLTAENCMSNLRLEDDRCFAAMTPSSLRKSPPCDYFLTTRRCLRLGIGERCVELVEEEAEDAWRRIQSAFDLSLRNRFPFSEVAERTDVTLPLLSSFFQVFDAEKGAVNAYLAAFEETPQDDSSDPVAKLAEFMNEMQQVEDFFALYLDDQQEQPTFGLEVQMRVERTQERGGNEIHDWKLKLEKPTEQASGIDQVHSLKWTYGQSTEMTLGWADNAPWQPADPDLPNVQVGPGRNISWRYEDPWSMLRLVREHDPSEQKGNPCDSPTSSATPETLLFSNPVAAAPIDEQPDPLTEMLTPAPKKQDADKENCVFIRVSFLTAEKDPQSLLFPTFPEDAPAFPAIAPPVPGAAPEESAASCWMNRIPISNTPSASCFASGQPSELRQRSSTDPENRCKP